MFPHKAFLQSLVLELSSDLKNAIPVLRAYAKVHNGTAIGTQASLLASLCSDLASFSNLNKLVEALSMHDHEHFKPMDWAKRFERAAELIGGQDGLRKILKRESLALYRSTATPRHPWPEDLQDTILKVFHAATVLNRLRTWCKREQKLLEESSKLARFQAGDSI